VLTTGPTGNVTWRVEREPFGERYAVRAGSTLHQPLALPGQEDRGEELAYNIFRWYRSGWGRYTQADPLEELRASEPNLYRYAQARPNSVTDAVGLWSIDDSCGGCKGGYCFGGKAAVQSGIDVACGKFLKKPKCAQFIENLQWGVALDTGKTEPLGPCMRRLCDSKNKIYCSQNTQSGKSGTSCAKTNSGPGVNGSITLMCGAGTGDCYFDQGAGWSHTIFHEMVHVCGLVGAESYEPGPFMKIFQKIMMTCAGAPN